MDLLLILEPTQTGAKVFGERQLMGSLYSHYVVWQESGFRYFDELSEIDPEYSLEGLILKLKLQGFRHLI